MTDLHSLLTRVEEATGPDRELDADITLALRNDVRGWVKHPFHGPGEPDFINGELWPSREAFYAWRDHDADVQSLQCSFLTASLDAALALVGEMLPGKYWYVCAGRARVGEPLYGAQIIDHDDDGVCFDEPMGIAEHEHGAALAVLAALLRALIAKQEVEDAQ